MAFNPTTLFPGAAGDREGAVLIIRPEYLWQDTAGTIPVTADGDPIARIDDASVNGRDFVLAAANPLVYRTDGVIHWAEQSISTTNQVGLEAVDLWQFMDNSPYVAAFAMEYTGDLGNRYFFGARPYITTGPANDPSRESAIVHVGSRTSNGTQTVGHWFDDANFSRAISLSTPYRNIAEYLNPGSRYTIDGVEEGYNATTPGQIQNIGKPLIFRRDTRGVASDDGFSSVEYLIGNLYGAIILIDTITTQEKADIDEWLQEQIEGPAAGGTVTGTGDLQAQTAQVSGVAVRRVTGTAALGAQPATVSGTVEGVVTATSTLNAQPATVSGAGVVGRIASGDLQAAPVSVVGQGGNNTAITATGTLSTNIATITAQAARVVDGQGSLVAGGAEVSGNNFELITATGALQAEPGQVVSVSAKKAKGTGALQAGQVEAVVAVTVLRGVFAIGSLSAGGASTSADIFRTLNITGTLRAAPARLRAYPWVVEDTGTTEWANKADSSYNWVEQNTSGSDWTKMN